ncbi:MAG: hypothetical protein ACRCY8_06690 [Dermatophilaceae bacterium]
MSDVSIAVELAVKLTATGVVEVVDRYVQNLRPGQGYVTFARARRSDDRWGAIAEYVAVIILDQDVRTAQEWIETHLDTLIAAARTVGEWMSAEPAAINLGGNETNALTITVTEAR